MKKITLFQRIELICSLIFLQDLWRSAVIFTVSRIPYKQIFFKNFFLAKFELIFTFFLATSIFSYINNNNALLLLYFLIFLFYHHKQQKQKKKSFVRLRRIFSPLHEILLCGQNMVCSLVNCEPLPIKSDTKKIMLYLSVTVYRPF